MMVADTQLMISNTRMAVSHTHMMVTDIHRNISVRQEATLGQIHLVGACCYLAVVDTHHHLGSSQVREAELYEARSLTFS